LFLLLDLILTKPFDPSETWLTGFSELGPPEELPPASPLKSSDLEESNYDKLSSSIEFENSLENESSIEPFPFPLGDYIDKYVTFL